MPAGASEVILFMILTMAQCVCTLYTAGYASHCLLVVVENTAAGIDEIAWPDEPIQDWLWKPFYLAWLVAFWLVPCGLLLGLVDVPPFREWPVLRFVAGAVGFWLLFPISLLASLSANSRWVVFRPLVLGQMLAYFGTTLAFYIGSGLVLAAYGAAIAAVVQRHQWFLFPGLGVLGAAVFMIYARQLGRLAWVVQWQRHGPAAEKPTAGLPRAQVQGGWGGGEDVSERRKPTRPRRKRPRATAHDPWAAPEEEAPPETPERLPPHLDPDDTYGVKNWEKPTPPPVEQEEATNKPRPAKAGRRAARVSQEPTEVPEKEMELAQPSPEPPPPRGALVFLTYPTTMGPLVTLAIGGFLVGLLLWGQLAHLVF
jgi:hypothetical protein